MDLPAGTPPARSAPRPVELALLTSVFVVAACGLLYELAAGAIASYVVAFGLSGVPFSIVVSLLVLVGWTLSCLAAVTLQAWIPTDILRWVAGLAILAVSAALSPLIGLDALG